MEAIALLLAAAGGIAALTLQGLTSKDRTGIVLLAAMIAVVVIFVIASDSWELGASWVVFAAVPLAGAIVQHYKSRARREA